MTVRWAEFGDIDAIQTVAAASWRADYSFITRDRVEVGVYEWYTADVLEQELADPLALILVAEVDRRVVGFAHVRADRDRGEGDLLRLYVHPEYRSRGIGRSLFEEAAANLAAEGLTRLRATVLAANRRGNQFYEGLGFTKVGEGWTYIGGDWYRENTFVLADSTQVQRPVQEAPERREPLVPS